MTLPQGLSGATIIITRHKFFTITHWGARIVLRRSASNPSFWVIQVGSPGGRRLCSWRQDEEQVLDFKIQSVCDKLTRDAMQIYADFEPASAVREAMEYWTFTTKRLLVCRKRDIVWVTDVETTVEVLSGLVLKVD